MASSTMRWSWHNLPPGTAQPVEAPNKVINLEVKDVPAFRSEDYMPPENEMKARVDFIYSEDSPEKDAPAYWKKRGKKLNDQMEAFIGKRKAMEQAVGQIVGPADSPDVKLQKIYARVQQLRNTSYEVEKTEQEQKRSKEKDPENVEEVWKKQYGDGAELTWLFLALARAAGLDASGMWVSERRNYFFTPNSMDGRKLDENVVVVKVNGKDIFFDPGAAFVPFGMLPWSETGVQGLRLDKEQQFIGTEPRLPAPAARSSIRRKSELKLSDTGDLERQTDPHFHWIGSVASPRGRAPGRRRRAQEVPGRRSQGIHPGGLRSRANQHARLEEFHAFPRRGIYPESAWMDGRGRPPRAAPRRTLQCARKAFIRSRRPRAAYLLFFPLPTCRRYQHRTASGLADYHLPAP